MNLILSNVDESYEKILQVTTLIFCCYFISAANVGKMVKKIQDFGFQNFRIYKCFHKIE